MNELVKLEAINGMWCIITSNETLIDLFGGIVTQTAFTASIPRDMVVTYLRANHWNVAD